MSSRNPVRALGGCEQTALLLSLARMEPGGDGEIIEVGRGETRRMERRLEVTRGAPRLGGPQGSAATRAHATAQPARGVRLGDSDPRGGLPGTRTACAPLCAFTPLCSSSRHVHTDCAAVR